jgi:hypothetical protein
MENSPPSKGFHPIALLFQRRQRRVWAYIAWLLVYTATAWFFAVDTEAKPIQMLPFLVPLALVIVQMIYPTLFVWALMVIPSVLYSGVGIYYLIRDFAEKQWQYDFQGVCLVLLLSLFTSQCVSD